MRREFKEVHPIFSLLFASLHSQYATYGHQAGLLGMQREEKEEIIMAFSQSRKVSAVIHPLSIAQKRVPRGPPKVWCGETHAPL